jgi:hypothetical protein
MIELKTEYKITTAKTLTELAIQNKLIPDYNDEKANATAVCNFFKTVFSELDTNSEE